jgi:hypothetical protein
LAAVAVNESVPTDVTFSRAVTAFAFFSPFFAPADGLEVGLALAPGAEAAAGLPDGLVAAYTPPTTPATSTAAPASTATDRRRPRPLPEVAA